MNNVRTRLGFALSIVALAVMAAACSGATAIDLDVSVSPTNVSLAPGGSSPVVVDVTAEGPTPGTVTLSVEGLPTGVTGTFDTDSIADGTGSATLTLQSATSAPAGAATAVVTAASGGSEATANLSVTVTEASDTQTLSPGGFFTNEDGIGFGALEGTIDAAVNVSVQSVDPPGTPLPSRAQLLGSFIRLSATAETFSRERPFVIAIPVPEGADTSSLALAFLLQPTDVTEGDLVEPAWELIEGAYDPDSNLFVTTIPFLSVEGRVVALVQAEGYESPSFGQERSVEPQQSISGFVVSCRQFDDSDFNNRGITCADADESDLATALETARSDFTGLGFEEPYLRAQIDWENSTFSFPLNPNLIFAEYTAELKPFRDVDPGDSRWPCGNDGSLVNLGGYSSASKSFFVCIDNGGVTNTRIETARHEYFHATQYGYQDVRANDRHNWVMEGNASTSENSLATMARDTSRPLHEVDVALTAGDADADPNLIEYEAQDFWVFLGQRLGSGLDYLTTIYAEGANTSDVDTALRTFPAYAGSGFSGLPLAYWEWAQNQAFEAEYDLGGSALGATCSFTSDTATISGSTLTYDPDAAPPGTQSFSLSPLASRVVKFELPTYVDGSYTISSQIDASSVDVKIKFYDAADAGTTNCFTDSGFSEFGSEFSQVDSGSSRTLYALVSNTSLTNDRTFDAAFAVVDPQVNIEVPTMNATFQEGASLDFRANLTGFGDPVGATISWTYEDEGGSDVMFATTGNGQTTTVSLPCDDHLVTASATDPDSGATATDLVAVSCTPKSETFLYSNNRAASGMVYADGTVVAGDTTTQLLTGDDADNHGVRTYIQFDVAGLPDDLAQITDAELTLNFDAIAGNPGTDLGGLNVNHVDYGPTLDASDYAGQGSTTTPLPGIESLTVDSTTQTVDMTDAVQYAWENRVELADKVQFWLYFTTDTDNDGQADHIDLSNEDRPATTLQPMLQITFDNF